MTIVNQNFSIYSGESKNLVATITDEFGNSLDLTGSTIEWAFRQRMNSPSNFAVKTSPTQISISRNALTVFLMPSDTVSLKGVFYHECKMTDINGKESVLFTGFVTILISDL